ncbi:MAG: hypothetical protein ACLR1T_17935 [Evtepia gabavorous]
MARAILKDAPIVVLDEATAFADPENEALIQKALSGLTRGRTRHHDRPPPVHRAWARTRFLSWRKGRIVEQGSHSGAGWPQADCMPGCGRTITRQSSGRSPAKGRQSKCSAKLSAQIRLDRPRRAEHQEGHVLDRSSSTWSSWAAWASCTCSCAELYGHA